MKFHIAVNLERMDSSTDMEAVRDHTLEMVQMADAAGFEIAWAAEHHAIEMTIAPNPFQIMAWWAANTEQIRLGCGVVNTAYWHPIRLAGEAAFLDLISNGRLEFGLGSGAYQREFDRMRPGLAQPDSWRYMQEMLPLVKQLWAGDVEHNGEHWQFPTATSCPKPLQDDVPFWVAARSPITFDYAVANNCNIMSWPLTLPFSEAEKYRGQLDDAIAKHDGDYDGRFVMMRHAAVYDNEDDRQLAREAIRNVLGLFGNLMLKKGDVVEGFPDPIKPGELEGNFRYDPDTLEENLLFGSPEQVIAKLKQYESIGVDAFIYYASMGTRVQMTYEEGGKPVDEPTKLVAALVIIRNPWFGQGWVEDLRPAIRAHGPVLGKLLTDLVLAETGDELEGYGKASVVGMGGEIEHAQGLTHTLFFGNQYRSAVNAKSYLAFANTRGAAGCPIMIPLMHKDDLGKRSHYQTIHLNVPDAPAEDEVIIALGASVGGHPHHRIGNRYLDIEEMGGDLENPAGV